VETLGLGRLDEAGKDDETLCEYGLLVVPVFGHLDPPASVISHLLALAGHRVGGEV
jgi:hypothetical protein